MSANLTTQPPGTLSLGIKQLPSFRRVYVWELPVRVFHWVNALAIALLAVTGYLIGNPQAIFNANEAYQQYWFGWVRFTHFAAGYIFFFNLVFRIYWSFKGNSHSHWNNYIPFRKEQFDTIWEVFKTDIVPIKRERRLYAGHNFLASFTYFVILVISLLQVMLGFALYSSMSSFFLPHLFAWVIPLFGSDALARQWHHLLMWVFIVFTIVHLYLVFYHDVFEGRGTTSSIIGGWTFMKDDELEK
jgi:Ni/Fe-hydrogenase 1 B-type cytochrome subunit